jgi:hypothetical protein
MAMIDMKQKRWGAAHDRLVEAIRYQRVALKGNPRNPVYRQYLRNHLTNLAATSLALRKPAEAAEATREMVSLSPGDSERLYDAACYLARCVPLAAERPDASRYADEAFTLLKRAVAAGWKNAAHTATDSDLDPLRAREDLQLLMMDLAFPADPFIR